MNFPSWVHTVLTALVAGAAATQALVPMGTTAHALVSVGIVTFAAMGIIPPQVTPQVKK